MERSTRRARPGLEGLEGRLLLNGDLTGPNGKPITFQELRLLVLKRESGVPLADRRIGYTTPEGSHVLIYLHGFGSLAGTTVRPDGTLDLVYNNTHADSNIDAKVTGGTGRAKLGSIRDADVTALDINGVGSEPVNRVNFGSFDLVPNGSINLTGGVGALYLNSAGPNTQIHLTALPTTSTSTSTTSSNVSLFGNQAGASATTGAPTVPGVSSVPTSGLGSSSSTGGFSVNTGGVAPTGTGGGGGGTSTGTGTSGTGTTTGTITGVPGSSSGTTTGAAGTTTGIAGTTSTAVSGSTGTTTTIVAGSAATNTKPVATGVDVHIRHVDGAPRDTPALADPQIFGYDPVANSLIRFDAKTGTPLQGIPLTGMGTAIAGVALGRDAGRLVALVGDGTTIRAFDAVTGAPRGQFSTANLATLGLKTIDGLGSTETRTVLTDSSAGALGQAQAIDVTASLASGQAVAVGAVFAPTREFELSGGATGLAGASTIFLTGAGHFDTFQPDLTQTGILALKVSDTQLTELARAAVPGPASIIKAVPAGTARKSPKNAFGSIDQSLALVTDDKNVVTLYDPQTLAILGTVQLADPNRLAGLSESFHPELVDTVLLDVRGNLRSFRGSDATGLVINDNGTMNLVQIQRAADSTIIARPINHVDIPIRSNVAIISTARAVGTRSMVTVAPTFRPIGPLTLP